MKKQVEGQMSLFELESDKENVLYNQEKFDECRRCWCMDCRHNERNEAVSRNFAGTMKACPACAFCADSGKAEPCEIGSYENGCKLRAEEEGIFPDGV